MAEIVQVRLCGFGGQGVVLAGALLGRAAARGGYWVAGSNSYGAQARGSACRSEVVLGREPVVFPHVTRADLLVAFSQEAYERFLPEVAPGGLVVFDRPRVVPRPAEAPPHVGVPATAAAMSELGSPQPANVVMLAAVVSLTGLIDPDDLRAALEEALPAPVLPLNRRAVDLGLALGEELRGGRPRIWEAGPAGPGEAAP